ncbi:MAG TPA: hypothetical protein VIJ75_00625 [Hanamia sp.]
MAYRQWVWFHSWFNLEKYGYLQKITTGGALVHERPTAFFEGSDYKDTAHPTWEKGWLWTGDQGMMVAALTDMLAIKNNLAEWSNRNKADADFKVDVFEKTVNNYINLLSKGIKSALKVNADSIIREAPFNANFGPEFGNDYLAGRGIMMRYLGNSTSKLLLFISVKTPKLPPPQYGKRGIQPPTSLSRNLQLLKMVYCI